MATNFKKLAMVDLDGVLNKYDGNYLPDIIPEPKEGVRDFLDSLVKEYRIKIFTTRSAKMVVEWLIEYNLSQYVEDVTNVKDPRASIFIDDRNIPHNGDFKLTLKTALAFKTHWSAKK